MINQEKSPVREPLDLTVAITCYNERDIIVDSIETVLAVLAEFKYSYEIIVIDDASRDDSVAKINEFIKGHPQVPIRLVVNSSNRGWANNFIDGAFQGQGKYYRLCCGDNPEPKDTMVHIFKHIGKADVVIPYQNQKEVVGKGAVRKLISSMVTSFVNWIGGFNIRYYNGMPIYLRHHVMRYPPITLGFGFQIDILTRLFDEGVTYIQVHTRSPIDRKGAKSTSPSFRNILSVCHTFLEISFRRIRRILYRKHIPRPVEIFV